MDDCSRAAEQGGSCQFPSYQLHFQLDATVQLPIQLPSWCSMIKGAFFLASMKPTTNAEVVKATMRGIQGLNGVAAEKFVGATGDLLKTMIHVVYVQLNAKSINPSASESGPRHPATPPPEPSAARTLLICRWRFSDAPAPCPPACPAPSTAASARVSSSPGWPRRIAP